MLLLFACFLFLVGICLILLLPTVWAGQTYRIYRDDRTVNCPETHAPVSVRFNALRAAWSSLSGPPKLRLADCTRWPERADCGQECIPDAVGPSLRPGWITLRGGLEGRASAGAAGRSGRVVAGRGLALAILVPSTMGDGARIERSPDRALARMMGRIC